MSGGGAPWVPPAPPGPVRHLYVHLPFCVHRCGYCDFVTLVGRRGTGEHGAYVSALLAELAAAQAPGGTPAGAVRLGGAGGDPGSPLLESVFLGGGTPTFTEGDELLRLLHALPAAREVTVEANPETVTPELADALREAGVTRVSLGAQSFQPHLLEVLERSAGPDVVRGAFAELRAAGFDNLSLDLLYGIPGQSPGDLAADLAAALALGPEHVSAYELEAKPGTRFTVAHGTGLERQAEAMEGYFETVVETLEGAGYRWYETANFCRADSSAAGAPDGPGAGRDLRAQHNLGYWHARDYLGLGLGAVSTVRGRRWRTTVKAADYVAAARAGEAPYREVEELDAATRAAERVMLGLRLDAPLDVADELAAGAVVDEAVDRLVRLGLVEAGRTPGAAPGDPPRPTLRLTRRGRFLGGGVTSELLA